MPLCEATFLGHPPDQLKPDRLSADRKTENRFVPAKLTSSLTAQSDSRNGRILATVAGCHILAPPHRHLDIFQPSYPLHPLRQP